MKNHPFWQRRAVPVMAALVTLVMGALSHAQLLNLSIRGGSIDLMPNTGGQVVELSIDNLGGNDFEAVALVLRMQVDGGETPAPAPTITHVDPITGTPWEGAVGAVLYVVTEPTFWDVRVFAEFFDPNKLALLGAGSSTRLASVTFDTTGLFGGTWALRLADLRVNPGQSFLGDTKYNVVGGDEVYPAVFNGQLRIDPSQSPINSPEPATFTFLAAGGLLGWTLVRRLRQPG